MIDMLSFFFVSNFLLLAKDITGLVIAFKMVHEFLVLVDLGKS